MSPNSNKQHANRNAQVTQSHINKAWIRRHGIEGIVIAFVLLMSLSVFGCGRRTVNPNDKDVLTAYALGKDAYDFDYDINTFRLKYGGKNLKVKGTVFEKMSGELSIHSQGFAVYCHPSDFSDYEPYDEGDRVIIEGYGTAKNNAISFDLHLNRCKVHPIKYETPELTINISDLSKIQADNLRQFENKYMGRYLKIRGSVYEMKILPNGAYAILKNDDGYLLKCSIDKSIAHNYSAGDSVEVEGEIVLMDESRATIYGCKINKSNSQPMQQATDVQKNIDHPIQSATDVQKVTDQPVDNDLTQMIEKQRAELKRKNLYVWDDDFVPNAKVDEQVVPFLAASNYIMKVVDKSIYDSKDNKVGFQQLCESLFFWYPECYYLSLKLLAVFDASSKRGPMFGELAQSLTTGVMTCSHVLKFSKENGLEQVEKERLHDIKNMFCALVNPFDSTTDTQSDSNIQKDSNKGKRCNVQTISNEKRIPKWSIEIIDSSIVASMLKDAEKSHLPFLKINASDDLEQKLVAYINKNPTRINPNSQEAFTCRIGNDNKTASGIGVQHVLCDDSDVSVSFLNLVSPVDKKARIYKVKTFDHLFEDSPVVEKIEESVINGERGVYVAVKYEDFSDGTGTEYIETNFVNYLFLGDKLRYLTDWNAFHIEEHHHYDDDGALEYSCNAKATVLRLEGSEAKYREHSFSIQ